MDIEKLAIEAGVIHVDESGTYWTDNNAIEVLENFARLLLEIPTAHEWRKNKD